MINSAIKRIPRIAMKIISARRVGISNFCEVIKSEFKETDIVLADQR